MKRNTLYALAVSALISSSRGGADATTSDHAAADAATPDHAATSDHATASDPAATDASGSGDPCHAGDTVVGCVVKGLKPNVYLIERAMDPTKKNEPTAHVPHPGADGRS